MKVIQNSQVRRSQWGQWVMHPLNMNSSIKKVRLVWSHLESFSYFKSEGFKKILYKVKVYDLRWTKEPKSLKPVWKTIHLMKLPWKILFISRLNIWNGPLRESHMKLDSSNIVLGEVFKLKRIFNKSHPNIVCRRLLSTVQQEAIT